MQAAVKATKIAMIAAREAEIPVNATGPAPSMLNTGSQLLKQFIIAGKFSDKFIELCIFEIEVKAYF